MSLRDPMCGAGRSALFCILTLLVLAGCEQKPRQVTLTGDTMGTTYHVTLVDWPESVERDRIHIAIERLLEQIQQDIARENKASSLERFNLAPPGEWIPVSEGLLVAVQQALAVCRAQSVEVCQDLQVQESPPALFKQRWLTVDLSFITAGLAVDRIATLLESQGVHRYLVEAGGQMRVAGVNADKNPWHLKFPSLPADSQNNGIYLTDMAMASSSGTEAAFLTASHQSQQHSSNDLNRLSVTVLDSRATTAAAWAVVFSSMSIEDALQLAEQKQMAVRLQFPGEGAVRFSSAMRVRLN